MHPNVRQNCTCLYCSPVERAEDEREFITKVLFNTFYKGERGIVPLGCCDDVYNEKLKVTIVNPLTVLVWTGVYTMQFIFMHLCANIFGAIVLTLGLRLML